MNSYAQKSVSKKYSNDTLWISKQYNIAVSKKYPDSAIELLNAPLKKAIEIKDDWHTSSILLKMGEEYVNKGDWSHAIQYTNQALQYCTKIDDKVNYYSHIGYVYYTIGDYVQAYKYYVEALRLIKSGGITTPLEAIIYHLQGLINCKLHQNDKAIYYFNEGEAIARKNNYQNVIAIILISKGDYFNNLHQADSALICYNGAIDIADKIGRTDIKAQANEGLGKTFIETGQYEKAATYLQLAKQIYESSDITTGIYASYYLGDALYHLKKYNDAEAILTSALKLASENKIKDNATIGYATLSDVYKDIGEYPKALECMDSIIVLKDSLESTENAKAINLMEITYKTAQKDKQIAMQTNKIIRKNMWILSISGCVLLLLLISLIVYRNILNKQKLDAEYLKSLERENKIGILKAAVEGGDNERTRIARELHDGIGGMLSAAMMRFSSMHYNDADNNMVHAYGEGMKILREMGDEIRKTAHNLMPEVLLKQSLPEAIRTFCSNVQANNTMNIDFQSYGSFDGLAQDQKLNLYRIIQELIKNIIQHAKADHVMVQLLQNDNVIIVGVEDNGIGFNKNEIKAGLGLHNMQTRVNTMDGTLVLESEPGKGTSVFIEFIINKPTDT